MQPADAGGVHALAAGAHLPVVPHSANLALAAVFTLHPLAAIPNAGPGWGVQVDPDWLEAAERRLST